MKYRVGNVHASMCPVCFLARSFWWLIQLATERPFSTWQFFLQFTAHCQHWAAIVFSEVLFAWKGWMKVELCETNLSQTDPAGLCNAIKSFFISKHTFYSWVMGIDWLIMLCFWYLLLDRDCALQSWLWMFQRLNFHRFFFAVNWWLTSVAHSLKWVFWRRRFAQFFWTPVFLLLWLRGIFCIELNFLTAIVMQWVWEVATLVSWSSDFVGKLVILSFQWRSANLWNFQLYCRCLSNFVGIWAMSAVLMLKPETLRLNSSLGKWRK
jgi:hypothetical protein